MASRHVMTILLLVVVALWRGADGHGFVCEPRQRGILWKNPFFKTKDLLKGVPQRDKWRSFDDKPHFPAGSKAKARRSGLRSQKRWGGRWVPYEPWKRGFRFRTGPCGDERGRKQHHMRGGRYYYPPKKAKIVATYVQGGILNAKIAITQHHLGFIEFTVCDVKKCGGEISFKCLKNRRVCRKLKRAYDWRCNRGRECSKIDPNHLTRWYIPCRKGKRSIYKQIKFKLPKNLHCKHCVLQWYYASADQCNPPGVVEYYRGFHAPRHWKCRGPGGSVGGYRRWNQCGGKMFTEEYYACSDIRIKRRRVGREPPSPKRRFKNPIKFVIIWVGNKAVKKIREGQRVWIPPAKGKKISMEALLLKNGRTKRVLFAVDRHKWMIEGAAPWVYGRNRGKDVRTFYRWKPKTRTWLWTQVTAETKDGFYHFMTFDIYFQSLYY